MASVCKVILVGNLGKDPEMRYTTDGTPVCSFSLATSEKYNGEDKVSWHNITAFGKLADICGKYLHKGKQIYVEGKIDYQSWDGDDGVKKYKTEIIIFQMQMLGPKEDRPQGQQQGYQGGGQTQGYQGQQSNHKPDYATNQQSGGYGSGQQAGYGYQGQAPPKQENLPNVDDDPDIPF